MEKILVTGANGQLGQCFRALENEFPHYTFYFASTSDLDITNESDVEDYFAEIKPTYCINAAAYTKVDQAEKERKKAFGVNTTGAENLARVCKRFRTLLFHISTDYVFDGETNLPYEEDDWTNPMGVYGESKLEGEEKVLEENPQSIVIRTSWLYSEFGNNFVKTMLRLFQDKKEIGVVADQYGQPTYAMDLASAMIKMINKPRRKFGIYHFSNYGETSWFGFATEIAELVGSPIKIKPLTTSEYPTPAHRPARSTMSLDKIEYDYGIILEYWQNSLAECLRNL